LGSVVLWKDIHSKRYAGLPKLQAWIRGWMLRKRLQLAGPGVLRRTGLMNDDELITGIEKERQSPLDYFAFEENGKIWWFSFSSMWTLCSNTFVPTNPYTKVPFSNETRKRLREIWFYNMRHRLPQPEESRVYNDRMERRLNVLCQIFVENGFLDVHPTNFTDFQKSDYASAFEFLIRDIEVVFPAKDSFRSRAMGRCDHMRNLNRSSHSENYILQSPFTFLYLLSLHKDAYKMAFSILSALYRC
jgi:hypothetical protein